MVVLYVDRGLEPAADETEHRLGMRKIATGSLDSFRSHSGLGKTNPRQPFTRSIAYPDPDPLLTPVVYLSLQGLCVSVQVAGVYIFRLRVRPSWKGNKKTKQREKKGKTSPCARKKVSTNVS